MKTAGKIFIIASAVLLAAWVLPWIYTLISLKPYSTPFTLYSCTVHDFTSLDRSDGKGFRFIDTKGNVHGDEAQPTFYASVLASKGALPDTIEGRKVTLEEIERNSIIASSDPKDVNRTKAPVYLLMESVPVRLELQDAEEAMVSRKDGIYIYEMASNELLKAKSDSLNAALKALGFTFPARLFAGKPSHRKEYDAGWLVTDSADRLFKLKQVNGLIEIRTFPGADDLHASWLMITEFENRATLAYIVDKNGLLNILKADGTVVPTEVPFNPRKEDLLIVGDMFFYTVKTSTSDGEHFYALRADDFSLVDTLERPYPKDFSLPGIRYTSGSDGWVKPRLRGFRE